MSLDQKRPRPKAGFYRELNKLSSADIHELRDTERPTKRLKVGVDNLPTGVYHVHRLVYRRTRKVCGTESVT